MGNCIAAKLCVYERAEEISYSMNHTAVFSAQHVPTCGALHGMVLAFWYRLRVFSGLQEVQAEYFPQTTYWVGKVARIWGFYIQYCH